jgi:K+-sensing histidine kinase KdpD
LRTISRIRPWSAGAFALGLFAVFASTAIQSLLTQFGLELYFAGFLPAVFFAGLLAGPPAAALVVVITVPLVWWAFMPPAFEFESLGAADVTAITMFLFLSLFLIFLADGCRAAISLLNAGPSTREPRGG